MAEVRAPTGIDEAYLLERRPARSYAELASDLLERCVLCLAGGPPTTDALRGLTIGDREALMLHLRAAAFGDRFVCVVACPRCEERMDVALSVQELLCAPYAEMPPRHEITVESEEQRWRVCFRLPTGADQEAAAQLDSVEAGVRLLAERCVEVVAPEGSSLAERSGERSVADLTGAALDELSAAMVALDPQAEIRLRMTCPECEHEFTSLLDAGATVISELTQSVDQLLREVHAIALRYHWSERDILGLEVSRRRRYLRLLVETEEPAGVAA